MPLLFLDLERSFYILCLEAVKNSALFYKENKTELIVIKVFFPKLFLFGLGDNFE